MSEGRQERNRLIRREFLLMLDQELSAGRKSGEALQEVYQRIYKALGKKYFLAPGTIFCIVTNRNYGNYKVERIKRKSHVDERR